MQKINHRLLKNICSICDKGLVSIMYETPQIGKKEKYAKDLIGN